MDTNRQGEGGSGSAENQGQSRKDQISPTINVGADERQNIAEQAGIQPEDISDIKDLGLLSGRGDAAGGSGDNMEGTSTNEGTERF